MALALISSSRWSRGESAAALVSVTRPEPIFGRLALVASDRTRTARDGAQKRPGGHLGETGEHLVLRSGDGDDLAGPDVLQGVPDQTVGLEPHRVRQPGHVEVGALVHLGMGEAWAERGRGDPGPC